MLARCSQQFVELAEFVVEWFGRSSGHRQAQDR
jgi:hypothetical protein